MQLKFLILHLQSLSQSVDSHLKRLRRSDSPPLLSPPHLQPVALLLESLTPYPLSKRNITPSSQPTIPPVYGVKATKMVLHTSSSIVSIFASCCRYLYIYIYIYMYLTFYIEVKAGRQAGRLWCRKEEEEEGGGGGEGEKNQNNPTPESRSREEEEEEVKD
jgi:hypothetical protein